MMLLAENRAGKDLEVTMCSGLTLASSHSLVLPSHGQRTEEEQQKQENSWFKITTIQ